MKLKLLPHYFKYITSSLIIIAIISLFLNATYPNFLNIETPIFNWIFKIFILGSLLLFVFTQDKNETEVISNLRLNNILRSVGFGVAFLIVDTLSEVFSSEGKFDMASGYEIVMICLIYHLISFYIRKNIKTVFRA